MVEMRRKKGEEAGGKGEGWEALPQTKIFHNTTVTTA